MAADGAYNRSAFADMDVAAVSAFPDNDGASFENFAVFNACKKLAISFFVLCFNFAYAFKTGSNLFKAFCTGFFGKGLVHIGPFIVFAGCSCGKVLCGGADAVEIFEPKFCMLFFVFCGFKEKCSNLLLTFFFCFACKIGIFVSCLRFACESSHKILFGFSSFKFHSGVLLFGIIYCIIG